MKAKPNIPYSRAALGALLILLDSKEGASINRLALYLEAADRVEELVSAGNSPAEAFADCFIPTRGMHGIAKRLGLGLDVIRGQWQTITPAAK